MASRPRPLWILLLLLALVAAPGWQRAHAFHFPWDQGHDTFQPDPDDDDTDPDDDDCNNTGSPFEVSTGNFVYELPVLIIPSVGPDLDLHLNYNARDMRAGAFGVGWNHNWDQAIAETSDGVMEGAICRSATGKRERYTRLSDGSFQAPPDRFVALSGSSSSGFVVTEKGGTQRIYNDRGQLSAWIDPNGNTVTLIYDTDGYLEAIQGAVGRLVQFLKGADGRVAEVVSPAGNRHRFGYDPQGRLATYTDPEGHSSQYQYDGKNNLIQIVDGRGNTALEVTYDTSNRVRTYTEGEDRWTVDYFPAEGRTVKTNSLGEAWTVFYDGNGSIVRSVDPLGGEERFEYGTNELITSFTDKNGRTTRYEYDSRGNVARMIDPVGAVTVMTYQNDRISSVRDSARGLTRMEYDAAGNMTGFVDARGNRTTMTYDAQGQVMQIQDALGGVTRHVYDSLGNLVATVDSGGGTWSFTFDADGNQTSATDPSGNLIQLIFDGNNRLAQVTDAVGGVTRNTYDAAGNLVAYIDAAARTTAMIYDEHDRLARITRPDGSEYSFAHDVKGNLVTRTDPAGRVTTFTYDALNRPSSKQLPGGLVTYSYDAVGNVATVTDDDSDLAFRYDSLNRLVREEVLAGGVQPAHVLTSSYDSRGYRTATSSSMAGTWSYSRDPLGNLLSVTDPGGHGVNLDYDALLRVISVSYSNGVSTTVDYDAGSQVAGLRTAAGVTALADRAWSYDGAGSRVGARLQGEGVTYSYRPDYRLLGAVYGAGSQANESYAYDAIGNRSSSHLSSSHRHDAANRLIEDDDRLFEYDAAGNLTASIDKASGDRTTYAYDGDNRLIRVTAPSGSVSEYFYDGLGRRIGKALSGVRTAYLYDGGDLLAEVDGTGQLVASYTHGDGVDEPLIRAAPGDVRFLHRDVLGSIDLETDAFGAVVATRTYDSYGRVVAETGSSPSPYGYTARELDRETGLGFYRARHYDPVIGRFLQEDPRGLGGGDSNLYLYVSGDPLNLVDPDGELPVLLVGFLVGAGIDLALQLLFNGGRFDCVNWWEVGLAGGLGALGGQGLKWFKLGKEFKFGKNFRAGPFGNRTGHPLGRWPHYHRRGLNPGGGTRPGQGIGRHRPWETKSTDTSFWDRF